MEYNSIPKLPPLASLHPLKTEDTQPLPHRSGPNLSYISPPTSRRVSDEEDTGSGMAQVARQSLPSIHEALGSQQSSALPGAQSGAKTDFPPPQYHDVAAEPARHIDHGSQQVSPRSTYSSQLGSTVHAAGLHHTSSRPPLHPSTLPEPGYQHPSSTAPLPTRLPSLQPHVEPSIPISPRSYHGSHRDHYPPARYDPLPPRHEASYPPAANDYPSSHHYTTPAPAQIPPHPSYPSGSRYPPGDERAPPPPAVEYSPYGSSVKRQLDIYEVESAINEIHDSSAKGVEFSSRYGQIAHQSNKDGIPPYLMPSFAEIDELLKSNEMARSSLHRLRHMAHAQMEMAEYSREQAKLSRAATLREEADAFQEESKDASFSPADKKRRGRTALPGRCHSCNRLETPEWRRGPDGARTLCNACGLHWAKLKRKQENKNAILESQQSSS